MILDWIHFRDVWRLHEAAEHWNGPRTEAEECAVESIFPGGFLERLREAVVGNGDVDGVIGELDGDVTLVDHALYVVGVVRGYEDYRRRLAGLRRRVVKQKDETAARARARRRAKVR